MMLLTRRKVFARRRGCRHIFLLWLALSAAATLGFAQTTQPGSGGKKPLPPRPTAPMTEQHIALLFAGQGSADKILVTLNNNRAGVLSVTPTLYRLTGQSVTLPSIELQQSESRLIDFAQSLRHSGIQGQFGYMDLNYSGRIMELGAQLTLYPLFGRGGVDSPRSLSVDFKSTERAVTAWLPEDAQSVIALTNVSAQAVLVRLSGDEETTVAVAPHETVLRRRVFDSNKIHAMSVEVGYDGPVDAVRAFGYVSEGFNKSFPLRFSDPAASTSAPLTAVGLRTSAPTHIALRNLQGTAASYHLHFAEIGSLKPKVVDTPAETLEALSNQELTITKSLKQLGDMGVERATLTLVTQATSKGLVAAATQELASDLVEDVPFRPSNPRRFMRGAYPLRWTGDYTNHPMVANASDIPMTVRAYVIAGGTTYLFPLRDVPANTTAVFDVDAVRANKTPDLNGKFIPQDAPFGKFHWAPMISTKTAEGLSGRTEVFSAADKRASSFSCGFMCDYDTDEFPYFDLYLAGLYKAPNQSPARMTTATEFIQDGYGNYGNYPISYDTSKLGYPSFDNTSMLNASTSLAGDQKAWARVDSGNYGTTSFRYVFTQEFGTQSEDGSYCTYGGPSTNESNNSQVPGCAIPDDESTQYIQQVLADTTAVPTASDFLQTLLTVGNDDGSTITEGNNAAGNDSCYFQGSPYSPFNSVSGSSWLIGGINPGQAESQVVVPGHNQWGPDEIGYGAGPVQYYQQNRARLGLSLPCGATFSQNLTITCSQTQEQGPITYKGNNPLSSTIDATGITNCRSSRCSPHTNYQ